MTDSTMSQFATKDDLIAAQAARIAELEQGKCLHQIAEPAAALTEQDAALLSQGIELLLAISNDERNSGNCSAAEGTTASAYAVQRLAAVLLTTQHAAPQAVHPAAPDMRDAYSGAREDLAIWKRRALEAERDLRIERDTSARLVAKINAANGPAYLGGPAHPALGVPTQVEPFMWAIQEPDGRAYMDENCVNSVRESLDAEVNGLNSGLDAEDGLYKVVPVYLAATQPAAQGLDAPHEWEGIHTMPTCDDLIWLYCQDTNTIDGPIAPDPSLEQYGWTHWAYASAPSTAGIDAAQAKQGGAA